MSISQPAFASRRRGVLDRGQGADERSGRESFARCAEVGAPPDLPARGVDGVEFVEGPGEQDRDVLVPCAMAFGRRRLVVMWSGSPMPWGMTLSREVSADRLPPGTTSKPASTASATRVSTQIVESRAPGRPSRGNRLPHGVRAVRWCTGRLGRRGQSVTACR